MRKALDAQRNRQKKLTVLREYAQDPLTSNEESPTKTIKSIDKSSEQIPLLSSISRCRNDDLGMDNYVSTDISNVLPTPGVDDEHKYRMLLISLPAKKKGEVGGKYGGRKRIGGDPNLVSSYSRRKSLQQNSDLIESANQKSTRRRRPPATRRRARQRASRNDVTAVAPSHDA
uniref:Uncharacterized protein n=1 Tax=Ciona savignyi TaxID=51511 RepID=H2YAQ6_CIOSA